jgi:aminopeptidase
MSWSPRWQELARRIADQLRIGPDVRVAVTTTGLDADPAVHALVTEVYIRGGIAQVVLADTRFDQAALAYASADLLAVPPPLQLAALDWADVLVAFRPMTIADPPSAEPDRQMLQRRGMGMISAARWDRVRWTIVRIPTHAWAARIGMEYEALLAQFMAGTIVDWATLSPSWHRLADRLDAAREVRIISADTDLNLRVTGQHWVVFDGENNLPDGELATAPLDDSAEGQIRFPGRFWFADTAIRDLRLRFKHGVVVEALAEEGETTVHSLLDTDEGARRIGELGIGVNPAITALTGDLFFDEKILGTVHIALGRAYPQCGGTNHSALHWDLVKDLRSIHSHVGGALVVDDEYLIRNGRPSAALTTGSGHDERVQRA